MTANRPPSWLNAGTDTLDRKVVEKTEALRVRSDDFADRRLELAFSGGNVPLDDPPF